MAVISDTIGDTLTRIRNGQRSNKKTVCVFFSNVISNLLDVLKKEGYIRFFEIKELKKGISIINVELKYFNSMPVIHKIERISKPGRRIYSKVKDLKLICNGLGISILSTPKGIMSDYDARKSNLGGEVMCKVL